MELVLLGTRIRSFKSLDSSNSVQFLFRIVLLECTLLLNCSYSTDCGPVKIKQTLQVCYLHPLPVLCIYICIHRQTTYSSITLPSLLKKYISSTHHSLIATVAGKRHVLHFILDLHGGPNCNAQSVCMKNGMPRCYAKSHTAQDTFQPIPDLIRLG